MVDFIDRLKEALDTAEGRLVITGALFMAYDRRDLFKKKYGTYGLQALNKLMSPEEKADV